MENPFDCITDFIFVETEMENADVILVPGGSHPQLMEKAAELYHKGYAPEVILKEDQAQNTFENAWYSFRVLRELGITPNRVILACKAGHSRRALLTYQTVFPSDTKFMVAPVIDKTGIRKDNWYQSEESIKRIMLEVEKIGKYFGHHISNWVNK